MTSDIWYGNIQSVKYNPKYQHGYLLLVAMFLIVIIGLLGATITSMFVGKTRASTNVFASNQAFYIAMSGLEIVKRALITKSITCTNITNTYTNIDFPNNSSSIGAFTITGTTNTASSQLFNAIGNTDTNITLINTNGLAPTGTATIESETIYYSNIIGNTLTNVSRGFNGTTAVSHLAATSLVQNICDLQSTGWVKTLANDNISPIGKRALRESIILRMPSSTGSQCIPVNCTLPSTIPVGAIISGGAVSINSTNNSITNANSDGLGCAVAASRGVDPAIYQCKSTNGYTNTVWPSNQQISTNAATFYSYFFTTQPNTGTVGQGGLEGSGYKATSASAINNIITSGKTGYGKDVVWYNGNLSLTSGSYLTTVPTAYPKTKILIVEGNLTLASGVTIGSSTNPVIIIVNNSSNKTRILTSTGAIIYGFVFVDGQTVLQNGAILYGELASVQGVTLLNNVVVNFTQAVFDALSSQNIIPMPDISEVFI